MKNTSEAAQDGVPLMPAKDGQKHVSRKSFSWSKHIEVDGEPRSAPGRQPSPGVTDSTVPGVAQDWGIAWNVMGARYGRVDGISDRDESWEPLPFLGAVAGLWHNEKDDRENWFCNPGEMVAALKTAVDSRDAPWRVPGKDAALLPVKGAGKKSHLLFQYKPYLEQDPLNLSDLDISAAMEAVFGSTMGEGSYEHTMHSPLEQASHAGMVILIKLVMDLYIQHGSEASFPLVAYLLRKPLLFGDTKSKCAVFDLIINLMVHGDLIYPEDEELWPEDETNVEALGK